MTRPPTASLYAAIPSGARVLLDTVVVISYLEGADRWAQVAKVVFEDLIRSGRNPALVSMVTVTEALVRPLRRDSPGHEPVLDFFGHWPHLDVIAPDIDVAVAAATLRARHGFRTPDALILATGLVAGATRIVTADARWDRPAALPRGVRICDLSHHLPDAGS